MFKPTKILFSATMVLVALMLSSCASLFTKTNQTVEFKGIPGTTLVDKGKNKVIGQIGDNGFAPIQLRKSLSSKHIEASLEGYTTNEYTLGTKIQGWFWGNFVFGGIPGMAIDAATGKMMKYKDDMVDVTLKPIPGYFEEEEVVVTQTPVDRHNPGVTDAEQAIVRWYIDSDPRGARIFYRVISNVPNEVKNTNETYMTTTPIEETKGFNIPGLTLENARNVTIEIKVSKRGFEDQVKRYNVRQAIDQQEISGFFELVSKDKK